jgi:hypothetical protein
MRGGEFLRLLLALAVGLGAGAAVQHQLAPAPAARAEATEAAAASEPRPAAGKAAEGTEEEEEETAAPDFDAELVMYDQPRRMQEALAHLAPQTPGKTDLYFLAFGGDGAEDVFRNEAEYAQRLMEARFDAKGHTLALVNHPTTVDTRPLATWSNLDLALDGLEKRMDPDEDVLVLFLTTHGSADHVLLVDLDPLPLDQIGADDLADILAKRPFRWKVVIVSACYSGGFVDPLKNATTMVITAARADRSSFGCGSDADLTYFGRAFFAEGLNQSDSFKGAFGIARTLVEEWEDRDGEEHSEPQLASTPMIEAKLRSWREGITLGAPLPFAAPADTRTAKR